MTDNKKGNLGEKLITSAKAIELKHQEQVFQQKPINLYDALIQSSFGTFLDDLIGDLHEFEGTMAGFPNLLKFHRQIVIYFNQLGINEYTQKELDGYEQFYNRFLKEVEIGQAQDKINSLEGGKKNIDLEIKNISASEFYEADKEKSISLGKKLVAEYLKKIGGEENLTIDLINENPKGYTKEQIVNGKYYLLLMLRDLNDEESKQGNEHFKRLQGELKGISGELNHGENEKLEYFLINLDPKYSAVAYHARFSQYKKKQLEVMLKTLKPLP